MVWEVVAESLVITLWIIITILALAEMWMVMMISIIMVVVQMVFTLHALQICLEIKEITCVDLDTRAPQAEADGAGILQSLALAINLKMHLQNAEDGG